MVLEDLKHQEHHEHFLRSKGFGMIQISVQDNGIGIKQEEKSKLFKLFGFLDSSKKLNSKGIGLGLHISQIITE